MEIEKKWKKCPCFPYLCMMPSKYLLEHHLELGWFHQCVWRKWFFDVVSCTIVMHDCDAICVEHHIHLYFYPYLSIEALSYPRKHISRSFAGVVDVICCRKYWTLPSGTLRRWQNFDYTMRFSTTKPGLHPCLSSFFNHLFLTTHFLTSHFGVCSIVVLFTGGGTYQRCMHVEVE